MDEGSNNDIIVVFRGIASDSTAGWRCKMCEFGVCIRSMYSEYV